MRSWYQILSEKLIQDYLHCLLDQATLPELFHQHRQQSRPNQPNRWFLQIHWFQMLPPYLAS